MPDWRSHEAQGRPGTDREPAAEADLLTVRDLRIGFGAGPAIVDGVDLDLGRGRLTCLVGESGSGKSLTALSLMRLLPPGARVSAEAMAFEGRDLLALTERGMERLRGNRLAMIFQEPMTSLNPTLTVGAQIGEALVVHRGLSRAEARAEALALLERVQIPAARERLDAYPHQLSGGMRQRVMIAIALACRPALLVADEPTTALDVTVQSQILALVDALREELGTAVLFITHNLAVVAEIADDVVVMYAGRVVERGSRDAIFSDPLHPYTLALFAALPRSGDVGRRLASIDGQVPSPRSMPVGCRFAPRCPFAVDRCRREAPPLGDLRPGHAAACWRAPIEEHVG
ncbi:ABC transporter ATP-binding protein [Salinarimonas soli]|uniref:ABC transporter ATP-binding protein n=1 Tax=Salinarimonas soli TaxID=1638099 RepID=A0A5B2VB16_9HYPH|nr:ABC transporter ATP-binding protein [Salinarimonas soli]KAA2235918.1 ABC transporter ATP-binding protein [Salinarimonas soli]